MPLHVRTSRISYRGPDALDITRKSAALEGLPFAPSHALLRPYLAKRYAGTLTDDDWTAYRAAFIVEMRRSYRVNRAWWDALLARESVTMLCYCSADRDGSLKCHRRIVAELLVSCGAVDEGEVVAAPRVEAQASLPLGKAGKRRAAKGYDCWGDPACSEKAIGQCAMPLAGAQAGRSCERPVCAAHARRRADVDGVVCPEHAIVEQAAEVVASDAP